MRQNAWNDAEGKDSEARDPKTGRVTKPGDKWDMGRKSGYEFREHQESATRRKLTREDLLDEHNDPKHHRPETPADNRPRSFERRTGKWKGGKGKERMALDDDDPKVLATLDAELGFVRTRGSEALRESSADRRIDVFDPDRASVL